ncbi:MAG: zf-HC2 domain-containing protein [Deltaproteobacteria bacterium]|nr:zf-HC2 domain-containing protein [Deltaproteobacteria bacterium]
MAIGASGSTGHSCRDAADALFGFLDRSLCPEVRDEVRVHFERCPPCVHLLDSYRKTISLCRRALSAPVPPETRGRLATRLRQMTANVPGSRSKSG